MSLCLSLSIPRSRRLHGMLLLAGLSACSLLLWSQYSSAAPRRQSRQSPRSTRSSRGGSAAARVLPRASRQVQRSFQVRPVMNQAFRAQVLSLGAPDYPPAVEREFRAAWVATVFNMDWPSQSGLPIEQQQAQIIKILDRAREMNLNALIWQVRPMCDAFYRSNIEPWSRFLTGTAGRDPGYDPLAFIVSESHKRGLEAHAWFNPYRAGSTSDTNLPANHISRTRPDLVTRYSKYLWLDPGNPEVRAYTTRVILDVVKRYDIDGVHLDDYFYPYVEKDAAGRAIPFPDDATYGKYLGSGGRLAKSDWRRNGVNKLVQGLHQGIRREKSWVKFGISPFGIWRPGYPASVRGLDAYQELYADSRLWLRQGWVDYWTPQLYWSLSAPQQPYRDLLAWWQGENKMGRHLWPGHNVQKIGSGFDAREILGQIGATREQSGATGDVLFSARVLASNPDGIVEKLKSAYAAQALIPASPWMDAKAPAAPAVSGRVNGTTRTLHIEWQPDAGEKVAQWTVQTRYSRREGGFWWATQIVPGEQSSLEMPLSESQMPDRIAVCAVDRVGNQSAPVGAVLQ